ncbi:hypothetical protein DFJ43DRAFT_1001997, partial [Lentinula guzmanii]
MYVERYIQTNGNFDEPFGIADTFISRLRPVLHVANFSKAPITIAQGQLLGHARNPSKWLTKSSEMSPNQNNAVQAHCSFVRKLIQQGSHKHLTSSHTVRSESEITSKAHRNIIEPDDPLAEDPIEGGPKTAETGIDFVSSEKLLSEVHISTDLTQEQQQKIEEVMIQNQRAFGLDGRLGNYEAKVDISMKPGTKPISLPPYSASPANREVI